MKKKFFIFVSLSSICLLFQFPLNAQDKPGWVDGFHDVCTSITCGKNATADGSVITSHTDDSHRTWSWMDIAPAKEHKPGEM